MTKITELKPNEVLVFGANSQGFHGAGLAGYACRGETDFSWRNDPWFNRARTSPVGSLERVGKWCIFGVARGWSKGREGMGYAIETIKVAGQKRSTPLSDIQNQFVNLFVFCEEHQQWRFLMTDIGCGLAGYSEQEMANTFMIALDGNISNAPDNLVIPEDLYLGLVFAHER